MEGLPELRHIRGDRVYPPSTWGVLINSNQHPAEFVGLVLAPYVRPTKEEALLRGQAIHWRRLLSSQSAEQRHIPDTHATVVGHVLAEGELAIYLQVIHCGVARILVRDALRTLAKFLLVLFGPPVAQIPLGIELAALIVETVGEFVPDHGPNTTEVH